jgi:hypothetical protein
MSLRSPINEHCKSCIYDRLEPGTWRQQVTLCSVRSCELHEVRPKSTRPIGKGILSYYGVKFDEYEELAATSGGDDER